MKDPYVPGLLKWVFLAETPLAAWSQALGPGVASYNVVGWSDGAISATILAAKRQLDWVASSEPPCFCVDFFVWRGEGTSGFSATVLVLSFWRRLKLTCGGGVALGNTSDFEVQWSNGMTGGTCHK